MKKRSLISILVALIALCIFSSCNRYIDSGKTERNIPINDGFLYFYADSNVLDFKSKVGLKSDSERYEPKSFRIKLPKHLKWYKMSPPNEFTFYYERDQAIVVYINLFNPAEKKFLNYDPSEQELKEFIQHHVTASQEKYSINDIKYLTGRKQSIIRKGSAIILLYNILPANLDMFIKDVKSIEILE